MTDKTGTSHPVLTFDCYGTLLDTSPFYDLIRSAAREAGIDPSAAISVFCRWEDRLMYGEPYSDYDQILHKALVWCDWQLGTDVFAKQYEQAMEVHRNFRPFDEVISVLKKLKEKGVRICLMSNTTNELIRSHQKALEYLPDAWLSAQMVHCYKPDLRFFELAEILWHLPECLHIHAAKGYWWDMMPAKRTGWQSVWIDRSNEPLHPDLIPDAVISDLSQIFDVLPAGLLLSAIH